MNPKEEMMQTQLIARGIDDERVINAMRKVPREFFVPPELVEYAYEDGPLPIGEDQTISQPYIVALMTQMLQLKGSEKILEIGAGSGYQTAVLAECAAEIYSVEVIENLAKRAQVLIEKLGYGNVRIKHSDGYDGWLESAPFDAIMVTCAPIQVPEELIEQLKDGGRMVIPIGLREFGQRLILIKKEKNKIIKEDHGGVLFVPMVRKQ